MNNTIINNYPINSLFSYTGKLRSIVKHNLTAGKKAIILSNLARQKLPINEPNRSELAIMSKSHGPFTRIFEYEFGFYIINSSKELDVYINKLFAGLREGGNIPVLFNNNNLFLSEINVKSEIGEFLILSVNFTKISISLFNEKNVLGKLKDRLTNK